MTEVKNQTRRHTTTPRQKQVFYTLAKVDDIYGSLDSFNFMYSMLGELMPLSF